MMTNDKRQVLKGKFHGEDVYYDLSSTNTSFIKLSELLRLDGIQFNKMILMTYDPKVIGLDPYDENLTVTQKAAILNECMNNFWYFIREVVRIPVSGNNIPYHIHKGNLAQSFCMLLNLNIALLLPRQHFKTQSAVTVYLWQLLFVAKNYNYIFTHKSGGDANDNLKRLVDMMRVLPDYITASLSPKDNVSKESILLITNNNKVRTVAPAGDKQGADKAG